MTWMVTGSIAVGFLAALAPLAAGVLALFFAVFERAGARLVLSSAMTAGLPRQNEIHVLVDRGTPAGRHDGGGVELLDDRGAGEPGPGRQLVALVERRLGAALRIEIDQPLAFDGALRRRLLLHAPQGNLHIFRHRHAHAQAIADDLDRALLGGMAVDLGMLLVETVARLRHRLRVEPRSADAGERHPQLVALAGIAHVELALEADLALAQPLFLELRLSALFEGTE